MNNRACRSQRSARHPIPSRAGENITKPDNIWFAHWDGHASTTHCPYLRDDWWDNHQRVKQYRGGHRETHGGVTLNIDNNMLDADVA